MSQSIPAIYPGDFHRTYWGTEANVGSVFDIQEDIDGYLWLTTSRGVVRFDGVMFETMDQVTNGAVRASDVNAVLVGRGRYVWLTTRTSGLILWKDNAAKDVPLDRRCISAALTQGMAEDRDGSLWVRGLSGLYHVEGGSCTLIGKDQGYPGGFPAAVMVDGGDTVWVKAPSGAIVSRSPGEQVFRFRGYISPPSVNRAVLSEAPDGTIWIGDDLGVRKLLSSLEARPFPETAKHVRQDWLLRTFTFSEDGSLWMVDTNSVVRFSAEIWKRADALETSHGNRIPLKTEPGVAVVSRLLSTSEGAIWIASNSGLEELRRTIFRGITLPANDEHQYALAPGDGDSSWIGNTTLPLTHVSPEATVRSIPHVRHVSCIYRDPDGVIWAAGTGLFRLRNAAFGRVQRIHFPKEDSTQIIAMASDKRRDLWVILRTGETYRLSSGMWHDVNASLGKGPGLIGDLTADGEGNVWFIFATSLVKWDGNSFTHFAFLPGPLDVSAIAMSARHGRVWLAGQGGLVLFSDGNFHLVKFENQSMPGRLTGVVETESGDLWMNGFSGVVHVPASTLRRWLNRMDTPLSGEQFTAEDGLPGLSGERFPVPSVVESLNHSLWFSTVSGVAWISPQPTSFHRLPPHAWITGVRTQIGNPSIRSDSIRLNPNEQNIEIRYTATRSLIPEKTQFRYRLGGFDNEWVKAGTRRQAYYAKLPAGSYSFQVEAANESEDWSSPATTLTVIVPPSLTETLWFKLCVLIVFGFISLILIRLRVDYAKRRVADRLYERFAERERLALDLHDTLLQSVQALVLKFHHATKRLPDGEPARQTFVETLALADQVLIEGRQLIGDLHGAVRPAGALLDVLRTIAAQLNDLHPESHFTLEIEAPERKLNAIVQQDLIAFAREALSNAFRHANSENVWLSLRYESKDFVLQIRDDGQGIDEEVLSQGFRTGHWGLRNMKERARQLGATYKLRSDPESGTCVEIAVPALLAYPEHTHSTLMRIRGIVSRWL